LRRLETWHDEADDWRMTIKVIIADDHSMVRQGLHRYLEMEADIEVVGEASNGREVLSLVEESADEPEVVILDVRMPEMDGLEAARRITERHPEVGVIMLSAFADQEFVIEAVRAGARGYVLKLGDAEDLIRTIHLVADGNVVINPELAPGMAQELWGGASAPQDARRTKPLSPRELEVLRVMALGHTTKEIAKQLEISSQTVKTHIERIFQKLGVSDRAGAVAAGFRRHLID